RREQRHHQPRAHGALYHARRIKVFGPSRRDPMQKAIGLLAFGVLVGLAISSLRAHADPPGATLVSGVFPPGTCSISELRGPLVLTDLTGLGAHAIAYLADASFDCSQQDACANAANGNLGQQTLFDVQSNPNNIGVDGARFSIAAGKKACVYVFAGPG